MPTKQKPINPIQGLVHVTGEPDTGKTTLIYTAAHAPQRIAFFDDDLKAQRLHELLHFGAYHNLTHEFARQANQKPVAFHDHVIKLLRALPDDGFDVLGFDNWSRMEDGIRDYSELHMGEISGLTVNQIAKITQLTWNYTYIYYAQVIDLMLSKAPLVILTTHVKEKFNAPGVLQARGQRPLIEKSTLRIWTRHNPDVKDRGAPIGLVLKRIDAPRLTAEGILPVSILPRRVKPCTWQRIQSYFADPIGLRDPTPDEIPTPFELSILDGTLTSDQKDALKLARLNAEQENITPIKSSVDEDLRLKIITLTEQMTPRAAIAKELGITLLKVNQVLNHRS